MAWFWMKQTDYRAFGFKDLWNEKRHSISLYCALKRTQREITTNHEHYETEDKKDRILVFHLLEKLNHPKLTLLPSTWHLKNNTFQTLACISFFWHRAMSIKIDRQHEQDLQRFKSQCWERGKQKLPSPTENLFLFGIYLQRKNSPKSSHKED